MNGSSRKTAAGASWLTVMLLVMSAGPGYAQATSGSVAPIEKYLMDRDAEIALARSAAPETISKDAEVLVLGRQGYETAVKGSNGFVCLVERGWAVGFDDPEFGSLTIRAPECHNAASAKTNVPLTLKRTEMVLAGMSKEQMRAGLNAAYAEGKLTTPVGGEICYMMSKGQVLNAAAGHWHPHLMFFVPLTEGTTWGANVAGSPVMGLSDKDNRVTTFVVKVGAWSDGTVASLEAH
jgi:hypothetical protein